MKEKTLLVMAAGMGSRFGGLKQVEPVGPNGEFIIDYSVYDAIEAGFNKVVFIIKKENYEIFRETIGKRIEDKIKVEYVFQENDNLPLGYTNPLERVKPWGTAHAILCAKEYIKGNFLVINADDFYGKEAYLKASAFLDNIAEDSKNYAIIGYEVAKTINDTGSVKRGVLKTKDGYVTDIIESLVENKDNEFIAYPLDNSKSFSIKENDLVSMNMLCLTKEIMVDIEEGFTSFLDKNKDNILKCEYLIPDVLDENIKSKKALVKVIKTKAKWLGVTYKEDKEIVVKEINKLIEEGKYL